jgi:hypothetical protein
MSEVKEYRVKRTIKARRLNAGVTGTSNGPVTVCDGDYEVYIDNRTFVMSKDVFEDTYEENEGDNEYSPEGHTVEQVIEFMKENPDQINRVKQIEKQHGERKTIMEYKAPRTMQ